VADISAAMYAYSGILAALFERERTGRGQFVDITLLDSLTEWMGFPRYFTVYGGKSPARTGAYHAAIAPYGPYASANGGQVFLAVQNEREWRNFCTEVLGRPELVDDPRFGSNADRSENRDELTAIIEGAFADSSVDELLERLDRANIANARMRDVAGAAEHPQLKARDRFRTLAIPGGEVEAIRPPMLNDHRETRMDPVPALGEHTESILEWIGLGQERELQP
jgi:crotonobetainyl-CoA:carnitine CoA-transferase CaiB-like acyl-CoA transferase